MPHSLSQYIKAYIVLRHSLLMIYKIFHTKTFDDKLEKMPKDFKVWINKMEDQVMHNPYVGDQLKVRWFREKKKDKFRIYYLIYEEVKAVYFVNISEKKDQQAIINTIWLLVDNFKEEIMNLINKN